MYRAWYSRKEECKFMFFLLVQVHCIIQLSQLIFVPDTLYLKSNLNVKAYAHFEFLQCIKGGVNANLADRRCKLLSREKRVEIQVYSNRIFSFIIRLDLLHEYDLCKKVQPI